MKNAQLIICLFCLLGCSQKESANPLVGDWRLITTAGEEVKMSLTETTFEFDLDGKNGKDIWGNYSVDGSQISFQNSGGGFSPPCGEPGIYDFSVNNDQLSMRLINDQCASRMEKMNEIWHKAETNN